MHAVTDRTANRWKLPSFRPWWGAAVVALAFVALLAWTWRTWPDPLIDFGRELYVPWQMTEGQVLYRDIAYFNGPLSPTINATLFSLFGVSLSTLIWTNVLLAALLTAMLYRFLGRCFGPLSALLGSLVFLTGFGFSHLLSDGNYNYICPYSHEATHGMLLSIAMLWLLCRDFRLRWATAMPAGVLLGLVFLTKAEMFLAAAVAAAVAIVVPPLFRRVSWPAALAAWAAFGLGAILPPAAFAVWLGRQMPWHEALLGVAGSWRWIVESQVTDLYRPMAGLDQPLHSLQLMGKSVLATALTLAAIVLYDRLRGSRWASYIVVIAASVLGVLALRGHGFPLLVEGRPLLLAAIGMTITFSVLAVRRQADEAEFLRYAMLTVWAVFSLLLLAKVLLVPRIFHYGFVLAMPATLLAVGVLLDLLPRRLCRAWNGGTAFRLGVAALLLADTLGFVLMSSANVGRKTANLGTGPDRIVTYSAATSSVGSALAELMNTTETQFPPDATFVALPEGSMLNYLSRRRNPTGFVNAITLLRHLKQSFPGLRPERILSQHLDQF
jgi:hypothetical protein